MIDRKWERDGLFMFILKWLGRQESEELCGVWNT